MDCLICYKVYFVEDEKDSNLANTVCKLLDISPASSIVGLFQASTLCPACTEKLVEVGQLLKELDRIQGRLTKVKGDVIGDLIKSEKLSIKNGNQVEERTIIVTEICSKNRIKIPSTIIPKEEPKGEMRIFQKAQDEPNPFNFLSVDMRDNLSDQEINNNDGSAGSDRMETEAECFTPRTKANSNEATVILKRIELPLDAGLSFNINDEPIASFIENDKIYRQRYLELDTTNRSKNVTTLGTKKKTGGIRSLNKYCSQCDRHFKRHERYLLHHRSKHLNVRPYQCEKCGKSYCSPYDLKTHMKKHGIGDGKIPQCTVCSLYFINPKKLENHMKSVHLGTITKSWQCHSCPLSYSRENTLNQHILSKHIGQTHKCQHCMTTLSSRHALYYHVKKCTSQIKYSCPDKDCTKAFLDEKVTQRHYEAVHLKMRNFFCDKCPGRMFYSIKLLRQHMISKHEPNPFLCTICNNSKTFASKKSLERHMMIHTSERPFTCQYCGKGYYRNDSLKEHILSKHRGE